MSEAEGKPDYLTWGPAAEKLLRTARLEASRSGHGEVIPAHVMLAVLDQPEIHDALRAAGQLPDIYAIRARVAGSSLGPAEFSADLPLSQAVEALLGQVRRCRAHEETGILYLLALKETLSNPACRALLWRGGAEPELLDQALAHID